MRDYQELVDILQTVVAAPGEWDQGELAQLAAEYAEQCRALNQRIGECFKLLREGQTAEAIRLAELEPRLIDWAGSLDFNERERWASLCELLGVTLPPALSHDRIKALNEAYALSPTLETLTRLWRYQNLARAAISERLDTLRRLAGADATNLAWHDDIRLFEEAWLKEIKGEVSAAIQRDDRESLLRLRSQIESATWTVQVPQEVVQQIEQAVKKLDHNRMTTRLGQVGQQLQTAYAAGDEQGVGEALREFDALCDSLNLDSGDPRRVSAEPAREWWTQRMREEEQRRRAAAAEASLERELDHPGALEQIVKLHDVAVSGGRKLPMELERRYRLVVSRLESDRQRGHQFRLVIAGALALVLLGGVVTTVWLILRQRDRAAVAQSLDEFIAKNELEAADQFVARLKQDRPDVLQATVVQAAVTRLERAREKEVARLNEFNDVIARIEERLAVPDGNPAKQDVERLSALARSDEEKLRARTATGRAEERWRDLDRLARDDWKSRFVALTDKIRLLEAADISLVTADEIRQAEDALRELSRDTTVDESLTSSTSPLLARLTAVKSRREQFEKDLRRVQPLIGALERRGAFEASLRDLSKDENYRFAADCAAVADALPWDAVDTWNALAALWNTQRQDPDPRTASRLIASIEKTGYPAVTNGGWNEFLRAQWLPYLESVARRDQAAMNAILKSWEAPIVKQAYRYCELADGRETILYSLEDSRGKLSAKLVGIDALVTENPFGDTWQSERKTVSGPAVIVADISPQRRVREELEASLRTLSVSPGRLETLACEILVKMIADQETAKAAWKSATRATGAPARSVARLPRIPVNDYIFAQLLVDTVTAVSALSPVFAQHWEPTVKELKIQLAKCQKEWMAYEPRWESDVADGVPSIRLSIPSLRDAEATATATLKELEQKQSPLPTLRWVGFVYYAEDNPSTPHFHGVKDALRPNTILVGLPSPSSGTGVGAFRAIATINDQRGVEWQYSSVPFGTPLFAFGESLVSSGK
ncbi:MAG: hypothetical protein Kow0040_21790 [Thermogutta sp.]